MFKNLFNSGKCLLGFHQGEWQYEAPGSCTKFQVCEHCQKRSTKIEHTWGEWAYQSEGECQQVRICLRCGEQEARTVHAWSANAYYKKEGDCTAVNYCERCGKEKFHGVVHEWAEWVYTSAEGCDQTQRCRRCGTRGRETRVQHIWDGWEHSSFYQAQVRTCQHCGSMAFSFESGRVSSSTLQDFDRLFANFARAKSVREISGLMRANPFIFDEHQQPVLVAYLRFTAAHLREMERIKFYKALAEMCTLWPAIGRDTLLESLDGILPQPGQTPWPLVSAAMVAAIQKKYPPQSDQGLVGHWIYTTFMGGGALTQTTDYHKVFEANGSFQEYSRAFSSFGTDHTTTPTTGKWSAQNKIITIQYTDGTVGEIPYHLEGNSLYFPNQRSVWKKA